MPEDGFLARAQSLICFHPIPDSGAPASHFAFPYMLFDYGPTLFMVQHVGSSRALGTLPTLGLVGWFLTIGVSYSLAMARQLLGYCMKVFAPDLHEHFTTAGSFGDLVMAFRASESAIRAWWTFYGNSTFYLRALAVRTFRLLMFI